MRILACAVLILNFLCAVSWGMAPTGEISGTILEDHNVGLNSCVMAYINITYVGLDGEVRSDTSETGKYGETYVGSAVGSLVHVRSRDTGEPTACSLPLTTNSTANHMLPTSEPWIALIKRGNCDFAVKVRHALRYNASAVLIYNDRESPSLDKMSIPPELRNISAVFTYKKKGEVLANLADTGIQVMAYITVGNQCNRTPNNINKTSVLFVSISFIVLMIISLAWLVFYYVQRFRYIHAKDRLSRRLCSAAKKALSKIPTKNIKSEDREIQGDGECCAVCIEPYKVSDILRILPCRHEFHKYCIDPWLLEHRTCPMCKMDILKHYGFVAVLMSRPGLSSTASRGFTGSQESILHMDIEEVASIESSVNNDTDRLQRRTLTPISEITHSEHQGSSSASPDVQSRSSRASSPDELTPTLCSEQCYLAATSRAEDSPSLLETSTQYSTATADANHKLDKYDKSYKCDCEVTRTPSCDLEDCDMESCDSLSAGK